jgi:CRP-like cAMP-binding protein
MGFWTLVGHGAMALVAISYLVRDMLWLRIIAIAASVASIIFGVFGFAEVDWVIVSWNVLFLVVNAVQMVQLLHERRRVDFTPADAELHSTVFPTLSPVEFLRLLMIAERREAAPGTVLMHEGVAVAEVILIIDGQVAIARKGRQVAEARAGSFLGEMGFLGQSDASATVTVEAGAPVKLLAWKVGPLRDLFTRHPGLGIAVQSILSLEVSRKLRHADSLIGRHASDALRSAWEAAKRQHGMPADGKPPGKI